jgi:hypothetical protein
MKKIQKFRIINNTQNKYLTKKHSCQISSFHFKLSEIESPILIGLLILRIFEQKLERNLSEKIKPFNHIFDHNATCRKLDLYYIV